MDKGDILFSPNHVFGDGSTADKYILLLNSPILTKTYVLVFVNSSDPHRDRTSGCHRGRDAFFVIDKGQSWFPKEKTFVLFKNVEVLSEREVIEQQSKNNLQEQKKASLKKDMLKPVVDCYKQSDYINGFILDLLNT